MQGLDTSHGPEAPEKLSVHARPRRDDGLPRAAKSVPGLLERAAAMKGSPCAARFPRDGTWMDVSWSEVARRARSLSDALAARGVRPGDRVAVISQTRLEAVLPDFAILGAGAVTVPIYPSELSRQVKNLLEGAGAVLAFCDGEVQADKLREFRRELPAIRGVVRFDGMARDGEETLDDLERAGEAAARADAGAYAARVAALGPDNPSCIIYTSGTTGAPKGVVLTQDAWLYCAAAYARMGVMTEGDVVLMFLPLAHSMGKMVVSTWLQTAATMVFARSLETVLDDAGETHPTCMAAPPRLFEKAFASAVTKGFATRGLKGKLFRIAFEGFDAWVAAADAGRPHASWKLALGKAIVFPKLAHAVAERFGGRTGSSSSRATVSPKARDARPRRRPRAATSARLGHRSRGPSSSSRRTGRCSSAMPA